MAPPSKLKCSGALSPYAGGRWKIKAWSWWGESCEHVDHQGSEVHGFCQDILVRTESANQTKSFSGADERKHDGTPSHHIRQP